jgi:hypothetical protein
VSIQSLANEKKINVMLQLFFVEKIKLTLLCNHNVQNEWFSCALMPPNNSMGDWCTLLNVQPVFNTKIIMCYLCVSIIHTSPLTMTIPFDIFNANISFR